MMGKKKEQIIFAEYVTYRSFAALLPTSVKRLNNLQIY